jgi:hypothetical protein
MHKTASTLFFLLCCTFFFQYPDLILLHHILFSVDYSLSSLHVYAFSKCLTPYFYNCNFVFSDLCPSVLKYYYKWCKSAFLDQFGLYVSCDLLNRVKTKVTPGRACSGWWRRKYNFNTSATSTLERGGWSAQYPSHFSRESYPRPSVQKAGYSAGSFWRGTENLAPFGFDPRPSSL